MSEPLPPGLRTSEGVEVRPAGSEVWLAASYHFPSTYSCKMPMSSMTSALALPAPGPGTVRLALIKVGIELCGPAYTREVLFPVIRAADVYIRPPERIALSVQHVHAVKARVRGAQPAVQLQEAVVYREYAHAEGLLTIYVRVPLEFAEVFAELLMSIGYWGQTSSLACCVGVTRSAPDPGECGREIRTLAQTDRVGQAYSCLVTEFRDKNVIWEEVVMDARPENADGKLPAALRLEIYVWPLVAIERGEGRTLSRK